MIKKLQPLLEEIERKTEEEFKSKGISRLLEKGSGVAYRQVMKYVQNNPFVIFSSYKGYNNKETNRQNFRFLISDFYRKTGIGGILLHGYGQEIDKKTGKLTVSDEWSALFVLRKDKHNNYKIKTPEDLKDIALKVAAEYDQDAILFGDGRGEYPIACLLKVPSGKVWVRYYSVRDGIADYYSKIKGHAFHFEKLEVWGKKKGFLKEGGIFAGMALESISYLP